MTATYFVNDLAQSITDSGTTQTLTLDPNMRMSVKVKTGGASSTETYAYDDDSDSPAWTQTGTTWKRNVAGIDGGMDMYQQSDGATRVMISNIRGDTVAEGTSTAANQVREVDEFGVVKNGLPASRKYGFHGSKQREALTSSGTVAMGKRLYGPKLGRFLQNDPILGGSAGPYDYVSGDPVNLQDLSGESQGPSCKSKSKRRPKNCPSGNKKASRKGGYICVVAGGVSLFVKVLAPPVWIACSALFYQGDI